MRWNSFLGSILFAAFAAGAYELAVSVAGPIIGYRTAAVAFLIFAAASYLAGLVPEPRRGLGAAFLVGAVLTVTAASTHSPLIVAVVAMVAVGFVRSALLYEQPFARALGLELILLFSSIALGAYLIRQGPLGGALAIWGVLLVQSLYFLVVGGSTVAGLRVAPTRDPFETAIKRANALLEG